MKRIQGTDALIGAALAAVALCAYLCTLSPTISPVDGGELATVAYTLGVAHPTGYPVFTVLGWIFSHLPLGGSVIWRMNLFAAVLCAVAVSVFYRVFLSLFARAAGGAKGGAGASADRIAAATAALALAFSETYWSQAVAVEVYSLHLVFLSATLWLFTRTVLGGGGRANTESGLLWGAFALVLGLSFANHMTTVLLAPGFLYLYFATQGFSRAAWIKIAKAVIPFVLGLSAYLYLPLRAAQRPLMNWGNTITLHDFLRHVSGGQYRVWMFSSLEVAQRQFGVFVGGFAFEFAYLPLGFALLGLWRLARDDRRLLIFSLLLFLGCLAYSVNYDIPDIASYFLLAYVATALWIAFGVRDFLRYAGGSGPRLWAARLVCAGAVLAPLCAHYRAVDASRDYAVEDYARNVLESLDPGAILITSRWDNLVSAAYYLQIVEGVRPDVVVIDKELSRRSWYFAQLGNRYPRLAENSRSEIAEFLPGLYLFEHGLPYNAGILEAEYQGLIRSFAANNPGRPAYVTYEIDPAYTRGFERIPSGLTFRLFQGTPPAFRPAEFSFRPLQANDSYAQEIRGEYAAAYANNGLYAAFRGDTAAAVKLFRESLEVKPGFPPSVAWLGRLEAGIR